VARVREAEARLDDRAPEALPLTDAVARNYFKLLAIKDEYEVARLYTDGEFERQVAGVFEGDYKLRYHLAPPLWARPDPKTGVPRKRKYGPWIRPLLKVLAGLRFARGRWFDPFGHTEERRLERELAAAYEAALDAMLPQLTAANHATAVEWACVPDAIRGYGHVKRTSIEAARTREAALRARFAAPAPVSAREEESAVA
jgi:indolepyruvate ferredoxin oxidoreductase